MFASSHSLYSSFELLPLVRAQIRWPRQREMQFHRFVIDSEVSC